MISFSDVSSCILCGGAITEENDSREHLILNSLGGRLKIRGLLCSPCNSRAGREWDDALTEQLNFWCLFFGIVRERGAPSRKLVRTTAGEEFLLLPGGGFALTKPTYSETKSDEGTQISITARTHAEARRMLKGLGRKYPKIDVEASLKGASWSQRYPEGAVHNQFEFGGHRAGRSIVKSAVAMAHYAGIDAGSCDLALAYLRNPEAEACFGYYYEQDLVVERPLGVPMHCVAVSGNPESGLFLAYVEYFGAQRIVAWLSRNYRGSAIERAYTVDPTNGQELFLTVRFPFSDGDILPIFNYEWAPHEAMERAYSAVIPTGMRRQFQSELQRVAAEATRYAFENCGAKPGDILTREQASRLAQLAVGHMQSFILRHVHLSRPRSRTLAAEVGRLGVSKAR